MGKLVRGASARRSAIAPSPCTATGRLSVSYTHCARRHLNDGLHNPRKRRIAHGSCLSRVPRRAARTVLRRPRRENAPRLSDNKLHRVRDVTYAEDHSQIRTGNGPQVMAALRNTALSILRLNGHGNVAKALRHNPRSPTGPSNCS